MPDSLEMNSNNREIEHKYLVQGEEYKSAAVSHARIRQGYISVTAEATVRIRQYGEQYFLTIKGRPAPGQIGRTEWEREVSAEDFEVLFSLCKSGVVEKTRWIVPLPDGLKIEVDEFAGLNAGLVLAEIEMPTEDYVLPALPSWMGEDVTSDHRYYNSYLSQKPFSFWGLNYPLGTVPPGR